MTVYETIWFVAVSMVAVQLEHEGGHVALALAAGQLPRVLMLGTSGRDHQPLVL